MQARPPSKGEPDAKAGGADNPCGKDVDPFHRLAEEIGHVFWFMQLNPERVFYVNPAFEKVWGLSAERLYREPRLWIEAIHPEDRQRVHDEFEACLRSGGRKKYDAEYRILRPTGEIVWVHDAGVAVLDARGELSRMYGIAEDITERKQAEDRSRESSERLQLMADALPVLIAYIGVDYRYQFNNAAYEAWFGLPRERCRGRHLRDVLGDAAFEALRPRLDAAVSGTAQVFESRVPYKGVGERDVLVHYVPHRGSNGKVAGLYALILDTTERRQAERELRRMESLNQAVLSSMAAHIAVIDREGTIIAVNEAWSRFGRENGVPREDDVAVGANYLAVCRRAAARSDPLAQQALSGIEAVLAGSCPQYSLEYPCASAQQERWFLMMVQGLDRPEGGAVISHSDITRQKQAEQEAQRRRDQLAHIARVTALGELAASIAHEVNQPLCAIAANAQTACRLLAHAAANAAELRETLDDIADDARRASAVIARIRDFLCKDRRSPVPVRINEVIRDTAALMRAELSKRAMSVKLDLAEGLPPILGDPIQVQQVVLNLMTNGADAMDGMEPQSRVLQLRTCRSEDGGILVSVKDRGPGFDPAKIEGLFDPFVSTKPGSLGMGLAISRSIVEAHGGRLWASPDAEGGAVFSFTLPSPVEELS